MVAFNFPANATNGQEYTAPNGTVYRFDGEKWNVKSASLAQVATSGEYGDLLNTPNEYNFSIGADDSALRTINAGESVTIKGAAGITTSSDDEGNITIEGGIEEGQTYRVNVIGDLIANDSTTSFDHTTGEFSGDLTGDVTGNVTGDVTGNVEGNVTGDLTGSLLQSDSTVVYDNTDNSLRVAKITSTDQNVYFGDPEVARIRVHTDTRTTLSPFDVFLFRASDYRSMKIIIQASNTTDGEYYCSELLCFHDGTDAYTTEYATMFTNNGDPDISTVAILNNGNFILRITPAVNVEIEYKFIIQTIRV